MQNNSLNFRGGVKPFSDKHKKKSKYNDYKTYINKFFTDYDDDDEYIKNNISCSFILIRSDSPIKPIVSSVGSKIMRRTGLGILAPIIAGAISGAAASLLGPIAMASSDDQEAKEFGLFVTTILGVSAIMTLGSSLALVAGLGAATGGVAGAYRTGETTKLIKKLQSIPGRAGTIWKLIGTMTHMAQNEPIESEYNKGINKMLKGLSDSLYDGLSSSAKMNVNTYDVYLSLFNKIDNSLLYINLLELTSSTVWKTYEKTSDEIIAILEQAKYYIIEYIYNKNSIYTSLDHIDVVEIYKIFKKMHSYKAKRTGILFLNDIEMQTSSVADTTRFWTKLKISTTLEDSKKILILRPTVEDRKYPLYAYLDSMFNISNIALPIEQSEQSAEDAVQPGDLIRQIDQSKLMSLLDNLPQHELVKQEVGGSRKRKNAKKSNRRHSKRNRSKQRRSKRLSKSR